MATEHFDLVVAPVLSRRCSALTAFTRRPIDGARYYGYAVRSSYMYNVNLIDLTMKHSFSVLFIQRVFRL
jgi:hypothetical protein